MVISAQCCRDEGVQTVMAISAPQTCWVSVGFQENMNTAESDVFIDVDIKVSSIFLAQRRESGTRHMSSIVESFFLFWENVVCKTPFRVSIAEPRQC